jgi:pyrimidine-specific ribonucleoside hydrolase
MARVPVILDCDPGIDDAYAIMLLNSCKKIDIKAITVVGGNVEINHTLHNALGLAELLNMDTRVSKGSAGPLINKLKTAAEIHGANGLGGISLKARQVKPDTFSAWDVICQEAEKAGGDLIIVLTGPLTNMAIALLKYPEIKHYIKKIIMMGGSTDFGNHSAYSEFNIWVDPHAADIVFNSGIPITMAGLNATRQITMSVEDLNRLTSVNSTVRAVLLELNSFLAKMYAESGQEPVFTLHDALAVAKLIDDGVFTTEKHFVYCETQSIQSFGRTVVDWNNILGQPANVDVAMKVNTGRFKEMLAEMVDYYRN